MMNMRDLKITSNTSISQVHKLVSITHGLLFTMQDSIAQSH